MSDLSDNKPITIERLEAALDFLAELISTHPDGQNAMPIFVFLEAELAAMQKQEDQMSRVRARLKRST
jgi:hypothetical protein